MEQQCFDPFTRPLATDRRGLIVGTTMLNNFPGLPAIHTAHVRRIARDLKTTPSQVLMAWAKECGVFSIPCTSNKEHMLQNTPDLLSSVTLSPGQKQVIDRYVTWTITAIEMQEDSSTPWWATRLPIPFTKILS